MREREARVQVSEREVVYLGFHLGNERGQK